jgi:hypothetical protein
MEPTTAREPRHNRLLIIVLTRSALLTAGHFVTERHSSDQAANIPTPAQTGPV